MQSFLSRFLLVITNICVNMVQAQNCERMSVIGGNGGDALTELSNYRNGIIAGGIFQNQIRLDNKQFSSEGAFDIIIVNMDAKGSVKYAFTVGNHGNNTLDALTSDSLGNIYISGSFSGILKIGKFTLNSPNETNFIAKADTLGNILWAGSFISKGIIESNDLVVSDDGLFFWLCGTYSDSLDFHNHSLFSLGTNFFLAKISCADGKMQWIKDASYAKKAKAVSLAVLPSGDVWVCGTFVDSLKIADQSYFHSFLHTEIFLAQISANGNWIKSKRFGGVYNDNPKKLRLSPDKKHIWMTGEFTAVLNIDSFRLMTARRYYDAFWVKMDLNGNAKAVGQSNTLANCYVYDLCFSNEKIVIGGYFQDSLQGLPKTHYTKGGFDAFWYGIDSTNASLLYSNSLGGGGNDQINALTNFMGTLLGSGTFQNEMLFNRDTMYAEGFTDGWLGCLIQDKKTETEPFRIPEIINIRITQNKNSDTFNIISEKNAKQLDWEIYNLDGKKILSGKGNLINASTLKAGIYSLQVKTEIGMAVVKLVKP
jgi:hypothetical protein